eukprot:356456-Chlamydomonas_euryale.AAC.6
MDKKQAGKATPSGVLQARLEGKHMLVPWYRRARVRCTRWGRREQASTTHTPSIAWAATL